MKTQAIEKESTKLAHAADSKKNDEPAETKIRPRKINPPVIKSPIHLRKGKRK